MVVVGVAILAGGMVIESRQDDRSAGAARGGGAIGIGKDHAIGCQVVEMGGWYIGMAVSAHVIRSEIVGNHQNNIRQPGFFGLALAR